MIDLVDVEKVAKEFNLQPVQVRQWMQVYSSQSREILEDAAKGMYDSPDHFMSEVRKNSTYNFYFKHAIDCRKSGLPPNIYADSYAAIDYVDFEPFYRRVSLLSFEDIDRLAKAGTNITPVNYKRIIQNLNKVVGALEKAAQAPNAEPILDDELNQLRSLKNRITQTVGLIDATNKNKPGS